MPHAIDPRQGYVASANAKPRATRCSASPTSASTGWTATGRRASSRRWRRATALGRARHRASAARRHDARLARRLKPALSSPAGDRRRHAAGAGPAATPGTGSLARTRSPRPSTSSSWARCGAGSPKHARQSLGLRARARVHDLAATDYVRRRTSSRLLAHLVEQPEGWFDDGWPAEMSTRFRPSSRACATEHGDDHGRGPGARCAR